jgi:hypothetical protein
MNTYEITLHRTERITVNLTAESPQAAIESARVGHTGFHTDGCIKLSADGEPVKDYVILSQCESCDKMIFDAADYDKGASDPEGVFVCGDCLEPKRKPSARKETRHE